MSRQIEWRGTGQRLSIIAALLYSEWSRPQMKLVEAFNGALMPI